MALSQADFYAYSRATGAPVPRDPEEQAQMAPEVLEFRRNQLKAPTQPTQQGFGVPQVLGIGAAALGLGAAGYGISRLLGRKPVLAAKESVVRPATADLNAAVRQVAEAQIPTAPQQPVRSSSLPEVRPSTPPPSPRISGIRPVNLDDEFSTIPGEKGATRSALSQGFSPRRYAESTGALEAKPDLTSVQDSLEINNQDQFINAVESGEDQVTGRINAQLQRNEDFDFNQGILTDRLPEDQTQINQAQTFLQKQREQISSVVSPTRRERILAANPEIAEAAELYASTGDPAVLSRFSQTPSSPLTVRPTVQTELNAEELPLGKFYEAKPRFEYTSDLEDKDIALTNKISALGAKQQNIRNRLTEIDETEPMLRYAMAGEGERGGYYSSMFNKMQAEKAKLIDPESLNVDIGDAIAERDFVRRQIKSAEELGPQYELINRQEGVRPYYEQTPQGEIIPESLEIRAGRPSVQLEPKSGGGRQFAAYDPDAQTKSSVGIYGIEPRDFPIADPGMRPTALLREETKATLRRKPESGPALQEYIDKTRRMTQATPEQRKSSLEVSEALRRANIEGRDPNMVLRSLGFNL